MGNANSGRKSWDKEIQAKSLWDLSIPVLRHALKSNKKEMYLKKIDIALALVNKMLPQTQKIEGGTAPLVIQFNSNSGLCSETEAKAIPPVRK